ncbi:2-amino-4-hydroxy-6-hydroxymethyldihydropteridine diphosphokinase [Evansella sp. AB-P1]|uniref:2-amino-4-hydroxy-6- hydroxymethyldihydropteridine diphosphokinase n=1 Tax=Evansella sp. AB-P1 TaxID=3037653 RepID=UPI00241C45D9|nr:2-amino-4-hydroxy-6-hydroxymethyldihydropteridine diphosphokinase [Evansella sp. AB-P1]MDG5790179.1 2-amino-4-hydroxy-6-hydroxymethyldihydropteridine diphosphokinase [Evansella sp. AB-P1]
MNKSSCGLPNVVYLSLGSNEEDREAHLQYAMNKLNESKHIDIVNVSSVYETDPIGYAEQPSFLNMVIKINTDLLAEQLLKLTQKIELDGGRRRGIRWGPRTIDLDILLFNDENIKLEHLVVPHPRMFERAFVIIPFKEIEANYVFNNGKSIDYYIRQLSDKEGVYKWKSSSGEDASGRSES